MKTKWISIFCIALILPYSAFADVYIANSAVIAGSDVLTKMVAILGPAGELNAKLADLGGDCIFYVAQDKASNSVSFTIEGVTKSILMAKFSAGDSISYQRTALSKENYQNGYYDDVFSSANGQTAVTISTSGSTAMMASIKTRFTNLTCGDF